MRGAVLFLSSLLVEKVSCFGTLPKALRHLRAFDTVASRRRMNTRQERQYTSKSVHSCESTNLKGASKSVKML